MQAQGALERDQNLLAEAQMDLDRYKVAWAKNAIPRQTLEDQEKLVLQDQGTVKNDEGTVQYDQVQVGFCHIASPIDGRVGLRLVDPGNLVTANSTTTLVVVAQIQPITVVFTLAEDSLPEVMKQLRAGKTLKVEADDRSKPASWPPASSPPSTTRSTPPPARSSCAPSSTTAMARSSPTSSSTPACWSAR